LDPADSTLEDSALDPASDAGGAELARALEAEVRPEVLVPHPRRDYVLRRALATADVVAVGIAVLLAFWISPVESRDLGDAVWFLPLLPVWLVLFRAYGLYGLDAKRITHGALDEVPALFHSFLIGLLISWAWFRAMPAHQLALGELVTLGLAGLLLVVLMRSLVRRMSLRRFGRERVLFIGRSPVLRPLLRKIRTHPEYGLQPVGLITGGPASDPPDGDSTIPTLGSVGEVDLQRAIASNRAERVIVIQSDVDDEVVLGLLQHTAPLGIKVSILPESVDAMGPSVQVDNIEGVTVLGLPPLALPRSSRIAKRTMDVIGASLGLLLFAPLMAVAALAIKLDSRGPILFRQRRIGKGGRLFRFNKFRTMVADAEERLDDLRPLSEDRHWLKLDRDPRITRVGRILRLTSIDELPQLWNVLRGDMSLVGPRPLIASEDERIRGYARMRLHLAPGMTGLWQVLGRTTIPFEEMVKLDFIYISNWSLWTDIKLLLRTIPAVAGRRGAN
jgi:exopolysaccharide biosynthesis polyprenyl glycosylphosphotransferase